VEIGAGAHVELAVMADEEQRALRHLLGALQERAGIAGAHLVGKGLAFLVIGVAGVRLQLPGRRGLREGGGGQGRQRGCDQKGFGGKSRHSHAPRVPHLRRRVVLNKSRTTLTRQYDLRSQRPFSYLTRYLPPLCDSPHVASRLSCHQVKSQSIASKTSGMIRMSPVMKPCLAAALSFMTLASVA